MTKLADDSATENAKKLAEAEKKASDESRAQYSSKMKGKPTPTQEENDLAACGAHILEHEADGSDPDPHGGPIQDKVVPPASSPSKPQSYQTRDARAHSRHE